MYAPVGTDAVVRRGARRLAVAIAAGALVATALVAPPAHATAPRSATIVEGAGMGGVRLGMSLRQVRARWGTPARGSCFAVPGYADGEIWDARSCSWAVRGRRGATVSATAVDGRVAFLMARSPGWVTRRGAGRGTTLRALQRRYQGRLDLVSTASRGACYAADLRGGEIATTFVFFRAAVANQVGVDAVRIYDPQRIGWEGDSEPGRPVNTSGACRR
ncbi:MAG: hypothetical protein MUC84_08330 [Solirubrobacteraceae bacterium]|jgi:hypothetical protein|nr:hypothetical protein [Solirubrobacteraceae bacterium]MCU0506328.1 hypothetical protein [Chloroflexota bacterium]